MVWCWTLNCITADVVTIEKTGENFRLIFDTKGRFTVHRISPEEATVSSSFILCNIKMFLSAVMQDKGLIYDRFCDLLEV